MCRVKWPALSVSGPVVNVQCMGPNENYQPDMLGVTSGENNIIVQLLGDSQPEKRQEPENSVSSGHCLTDGREQVFGFALE